MSAVLHRRTCAGLFGLFGAMGMCTPFEEGGSTYTSGEDVSAEGGQAGGQADPNVSPGCDLSQPFGAPTFVPGFTAFVGTAPKTLRLSPDSLVGYYTAQSPNVIYENLYVATRTNVDSPFVNPMPALVAAPDYQSFPTVRSDGLMLVFQQGPADLGPTHLYFATRTSTSTPFVPGGTLANVNSSGADGDPFLREDGHVLYFSSLRNGLAAVGIFRATGSGSEFSAPLPVSELNSGFSDAAPVVTPDDRTIYFASGRPFGDARGGTHIWTATRSSSSEVFSTPVAVAELLQAGTDQLPNFVSGDGCSLYLTISESDGSPPAPMVYVAQKPAL